MLHMCEKSQCSITQLNALKEFRNCISRVNRVLPSFCSLRADLSPIFYLYFWKTSFFVFLFSYQYGCHVFNDFFLTLRFVKIWRSYASREVLSRFF